MEMLIELFKAAAIDRLLHESQELINIAFAVIIYFWLSRFTKDK